MSYKDLEAEIKAWANLEAHAKAQKEDAQEARRQAKRDKRARKHVKGPLIAKTPAPRLERPRRTFKRVTIECRPIHHRKWGDLIELTYEVETMTDAVGEVGAIKQAREDGYSFERVVCIVTFDK